MQPTLTFCSDMLSRAMEDMSYFPSVLSADPAAEADVFQNVQRLSKYGLGADPVHSGELDRLADANRSLNASILLGCDENDDDSAVAPGRDPDGYSVSGVPARYAEESYMSLQLSEMLSPGMSMAQSFSRIEGRLSLTPHHAGTGAGAGAGGNDSGGWLQHQRQQNDSTASGDFGYDMNNNSGCMTPSDHGGYLDNSFESN